MRTFLLYFVILALLFLLAPFARAQQLSISFDGQVTEAFIRIAEGVGGEAGDRIRQISVGDPVRTNISFGTDGLFSVSEDTSRCGLPTPGGEVYGVRPTTSNYQIIFEVGGLIWETAGNFDVCISNDAPYSINGTPAWIDSFQAYAEQDLNVPLSFGGDAMRFGFTQKLLQVDGLPDLLLTSTFPTRAEDFTFDSELPGRTDLGGEVTIENFGNFDSGLDSNCFSDQTCYAISFSIDPLSANFNSSSGNSSINPDTNLLNFGENFINEQGTPLPVQFENVGNVAVSVQMGRFSGPAGSDFILTSDGCSGQELLVGELCEVRLAFAPNALGERTAAFELISSAEDSPTVVSLTGVGVESPANPFPQVSDVNPNSGEAGSEVTISGLNFGRKQNGSYVTFSNESGSVDAQIRKWSDDEIILYAPPGLFGSSQVTVTTAGGSSSNLSEFFNFPDQIMVTLDGNWPPVSSFPLTFRGKEQAIRQVIVEFARVDRQLRNDADATRTYPMTAIEIDGYADPIDEPMRSTCYGGAMDAIATTEFEALLDTALRNLAVDIAFAGFSVGLNNFSTGTPFLDFLLRASADGLQADLHGDDAIIAFSQALAEEIAPIIVARATDDFYGGFEGILLDVTSREIRSLLRDEDLVSFDTDASNSGSQLERNGIWPPTSVTGNFYYNPYNRHVTLIFRGNCQVSGRSIEHDYIVTFEVEESFAAGANFAIPVIKEGTIERRYFD